MSRQFDVHAYPRTAGRAAPTLVVILQHDAVPGRSLVVVAPLVPVGSRPVLPRLSPLVRFDGRDYALATNELAAIERSDLGPRAGSVADARDAIIRALDLLFTGF